MKTVRVYVTVTIDEELELTEGEYEEFLEDPLRITEESITIPDGIIDDFEWDNVDSIS